MKKTVSALILAALCAAATAKPYTPADMGSILTPGNLNLEAADAAVSNLGQFAGGYPTRFDNAADQQEGLGDARALIKLYTGMIETKIITPKHPAYRHVLLQLARLNSMAHNMDERGAAEQADRRYRQLIALESGQAKAALQEEYGRFLTFSNQPAAALPVLRQAVKSGNTQARRTLGLALLTQGKQTEAETELRAYLRQVPQDSEIKTLLEAMHGKGSYQIRQNTLSPAQ